MLVNLAYLLEKPTGTTNYALNLLPHLASLDPTYLATQVSGLSHYRAVPANMTAAYGQQGHLRRLLWTQFRLPHYRDRATELIFSPIPEAPVFLPRCRYVVTVHDLIPLRLPQYFSSLKWLYRYYVPHVLQGAQHILCNSEATAGDIMQFYSISHERITPTLLAYDADHFRPLGLKPQNYFLVVGRHAPYKNISAAIAALARLPQDYDLWIAGPYDPRYTPTLIAQAAALGLAERVKFLKYVAYSDLPTLINRAIALVFPSRAEGFGLPLLEAMACGTPAIAANCTALPEVAGGAAWLVGPDSVTELADAMQTLATDIQTRQQLRQAGLQRAQTFSWKNTGQATAAVLRSLL